MKVNPLCPAHPAELSAGQCQMQLFSDGYLFSAQGMVLRCRRVAATLLIALTEQDFELEFEGRVQRFAMVALRPLVAHQLRASNVPTMCIDLSPNSHHYRAFTSMAGTGVQGMPRERFAAMDTDMTAFHAGSLSGSESHRLFRRITNLAATLLPVPRPIDPRVQQVIDLLNIDPVRSVDELAQATGLSGDRISSLFSKELGATLRLYMQALKISAAVRFYGTGMTLTEIAAAAGFADSAHFSKVWTQTFGLSPVHFFHNREIRVHGTGQHRAVALL
jgi:AraC-like DNA-binding protein